VHSKALALVVGGFLLAACSFNEGGVAVADDANGSVDARMFDARSQADADLINDAAVGVVDAPPVPDARVPDAAIPDAVVPDAQIIYSVVEVLIVSCDGTIETSTTVLSLGTTYKLRASGTCQVGTTDGVTPILSDAEYFDFGDPKDIFMGDPPIDRGVAINDNVVDDVGPPQWGAYAIGHVYEVDFVGLGATIDARFYDAAFDNNTGSITVEILAPN